MKSTHQNDGYTAFPNAIENRQLSLTDVMLGMHRLSLQNVLSPANFRFFWGLIMAANSLKPRFKNPFDLTVSQAIGAGGGESRQAVNRRQQALRKVRIDGQRLITITAGSRVNNRPALYEINYNLLVPPNLTVPTFEVQSSQKTDGHDDDHDDVQGSILRSEERREDTNTISNVDTKREGGDENSEKWVVVLSDSEKSEEELIQVDDQLRYHGVRNPWRKEIATGYDTQYIYRQIKQIKKDFLKGIVFDNPAGVLVARIKGGHRTEDYPE